MTQERRRYFRIDDTVGISYQVLEGEEPSRDGAMPDVLSLVTKQDEQIEKLILELTEESPKVARLVSIFNQKLERIVNQLIMESQLVGRMAHKMKQANISACGIAFSNDAPIDVGSRLNIEMSLFPSEITLVASGMVVDCSPADEEGRWYWRIDFYAISEKNQEALIQHIVRCQSHQLKQTRGL